MSVEDGTVLARLFTHLRTHDQIKQFLWAFQDIQQPRCTATTESETHVMYFTCIPKGDDSEARDAGFRAKNAAQQFAVDALGSTVFGHDFEALKEQSMFVREYNGVMSGIANLIYLIAPLLERLIPRTTLLKRIDTLSEHFVALLKAKQHSPGDDMMSYMLRDPDMSQKELRDNMILLFISGHVSFQTTVYALLTSIVYL